MLKKKKNTRNPDEPFAAGISFYKLAWCFIIGSMIGTWYEEIIAFTRYGVWENRSAVIIGPFNPLYGTGYVIAIVLFHKIKNPIKLLLLGGLFGATFEYAASWAQEFFTGSKSWDYSHLFLNIHGRTTVIYAFYWGLLMILIVDIAYPYFSKWIEKIPYKFGIIFTRILIVFLSLNMFVTYSMLIRQGLRTKGIEPYTPLGELYDEVFTDEVILELFPNMVLQGDDEDE